jgi:hypothetical protein
MVTTTHYFKSPKEAVFACNSRRSLNQLVKNLKFILIQNTYVDVENAESDRGGT